MLFLAKVNLIKRYPGVKNKIKTVNIRKKYHFKAQISIPPMIRKQAILIRILLTKVKFWLVLWLSKKNRLITEMKLILLCKILLILV